MAQFNFSFSQESLNQSSTTRGSLKIVLASFTRTHDWFFSVLPQALVTNRQQVSFKRLPTVTTQEATPTIRTVDASVWLQESPLPHRRWVGGFFEGRVVVTSELEYDLLFTNLQLLLLLVMLIR